MARILGYQNAILRGKLGGTVYSANRYGEYARQYVKPVNPNTLAQATARGNFSEAVGLWHSLTTTQKDAWQAFATAIGGLSGINQWVAQRQRAITNQRLVAAGANLPTPGLGDETITAGTYVAPTGDPPAGDLAPPIGVTVGDVSLTALIDGTIQISATFPTEGGADIPIGLFDIPWGFSVYVSNEVTQAGHFINNPLEMKADVSIPFSEIASGGTETTAGQQFNQEFSANSGDFQDWPVNNYARLTFYWESGDGRKLLIGSVNKLFPTPQIP